MTQPFLRLAGLTKRYGSHGGVDDVSLEVEQGKSLIVLGPSGSGKTTLLRLIAGLEHPDRGEIWLDGEQVAEAGRNVVPAHQRRIGFVFQDLALWPHLTAFQNVEFVARASDIAKPQRAARIQDVLRLCKLDSMLAERYPHQLSGGEQQRVALARALIGSPRLLLLDEPFSGLDPDLKASLRGELVALQRQLHLTALYVTHDRDDVEALASRTILMRQARIESLKS